MGRITQKTAGSQGEGIQSVPAGTLHQDYLHELYESAYAQITNPQRVVVLPRYFLKHWLPLLGPSSAWLVLAFRQAAFVSRSNTHEVFRQIPVRQLTRWTGLSHGQVWNLMSKSGHLSWFVRKTEKASSQTEGDTWGVQVSIPVAPQHLAQIDNFILLHPPKTHDTQESYLRMLMLEAPVILGDPSRVDGISADDRQTVHDIAEKHLGRLSAVASQLCDEITGRIVQPGNTLAITHYFLERWRPEMPSGEAWMIILLRGMVYAAARPASTIGVLGGKSMLAQGLGIHKRSVRRWFSRLSESHLSAFIQVEDETSAADLLLEIKLRDPIHPSDEERYAEYLAEARADITGHGNGQKWTGKSTKVDTALDNTGHAPGQEWTHTRTKMNTEVDRIGHEDGQKWTYPGTKIDNLMSLNPDPESKVQITSEHPQQPPVIAFPSVVVGGWDLDLVLQQGGLRPEKRQVAIQDIQAVKSGHQRFFGWLFYGFENRAQKGQGIANPVLFALSRYAHSNPEQIYLDLASISATELGRLLSNTGSPAVPLAWRRVLSVLADNGLIQLVEACGVDAPLSGEELRKTPEERVNGAGGLHMPELASPLHKEPDSAEEIWAAICTHSGLNDAVQTASMWLNGRELEVGFLFEPELQRVEAALRGGLTQLKQEFPGYTYRLRLLQLQPNSPNGAPGIRIVNEVQIT
jgi:hypothetical protein